MHCLVHWGKVLGLLGVLSLYGQTPGWLWARSGTGSLSDEVHAVTVMPTLPPRIAIGGAFFSPTLNLGSVTLSCPGSGLFTSCAFVAVYDAQGMLLWASSAGSADPNRITNLAADTAGNLIAVGSFSASSLAFGSLVLSNAGFSDAFVVKYDPSGTPLWAIAIGGPSWEEATGVATDSFGNIYVTGHFESSQLTVGSAALTNAGSGTADIFLIKLSPQGQVLWARSFGGADIDFGQAIAVSPMGDIAITGVFWSNSFSIGSTVLTSSGQGDLFVARLNAGGQPLWAQKAGGTDSEIAYGIAFDPTDHLVVAGTSWSNPVIFDNQSFPNQGSNDLFVAKYSPNGQLVWARSAGGSDSEEAHAVTIDTSGRIYVAGYFASAGVSFGNHSLQSSGDADAFVVAYDPQGQPLWAQKAGGLLYDRARAIAVDTHGGLYVGGDYKSNPSTFGGTTLPNDQGYDAFLAKLGPGANALPTSSQPAFRLSPLPEPGLYQIFASNLHQPLPWCLYTILGTPVCEGILDRPAYVLDFSFLPSGMYVLTVEGHRWLLPR